MCKNYCFVKITLSIDDWSGENWFAYDVIGIPNSKRGWNILVCLLGRRNHAVVKINIQNCPISIGTKCFVYKRRVVSLFVLTHFLKYGRRPGDNLTFSIRPKQISFDRASAMLNHMPCNNFESTNKQCILPLTIDHNYHYVIEQIYPDL